MSDDVQYKVSYVIEGGIHPGAIMNSDHRPEIGEEVEFDNLVFEVTEVMDLMPVTDNFGFVHATCRFVREIES